MTLPQWMLLSFALWTIGVLSFTIGVHRWNLILRGKRGIHSFRPDASDGPDWYRRATRAHANCVENLPVFGALVALASFAGISSALLDVCACIVVAARVGQTVTHVGFPETKRSVSVRFTFFFAQLCSKTAMAVVIAVHAHGHGGATAAFRRDSRQIERYSPLSTEFRVTSREKGRGAGRMQGSNDRARALIYVNVRDVVFSLGLEGDRFRFSEINPAFSMATGLTEEQVLGKFVDEVIPEPSLSLVLSRYRAAIAEGRTVRWEEVTEYPAGKKYGEVSITPVVDADGRCRTLGRNGARRHERSSRAGPSRSRATRSRDGRVGGAAAEHALFARSRHRTELAANELLDGDPLLFAVFEAQIAVHTGQLDLADSANPRLVPRSPRCARSFHGLAAPLYDGSGGIAGVLYVRRPRRAEPFGSADLRRAHALSGHLSASLARVPCDVRGAEPRVVLSPREYQVAILAMRGANNLQWPGRCTSRARPSKRRFSASTPSWKSTGARRWSCA